MYRAGASRMYRLLSILALMFTAVAVVVAVGSFPGLWRVEAVSLAVIFGSAGVAFHMVATHAKHAGIPTSPIAKDG